MAINQVYLDEAKLEILNASYGERSQKANSWAQRLGISYQHLYRLIKSQDEKRKRTDKPKCPEYLDYAHTVFQIKKRPPEEAGEISTEDALAIAVKSGLLPIEASAAPVSTLNAIARKEGWTKKQRRISRFQADKPNEMHHFDASTSQYFYIADKLPGGDYLLKMHRPAKHYKNKPIPVDRLRPWIYGLVDDHSGRLISRYVAAKGEEAGDSMDFLCLAWSQIGLPEKLFADQGMLKKSLASRDWLNRLGIEVPEAMPYAKESHGKIERTWRTAWLKFEKLFFAVNEWKKFKITLSELNRQHEIYIEEKYNLMKHRFERNITRMQAWNRINLNGGLVKMPENVLRTVANETKRTVTAEGIVWLDNVAYEVLGLHSAKVKIIRGVFEDRIVAQDIATGIKYDMREFKPLALGEYKAHPATPHQQLIKDDQLNVSHDALLYAEKKTAPEKILAMPIKTKEEREVNDPFDITVFASINEAMKEFSEIVGFVPADQREVIEQTIQENGLSKNFVLDLALEIRSAIEQKKAVNG